MKEELEGWGFEYGRVETSYAPLNSKPGAISIIFDAEPERALIEKLEAKHFRKSVFGESKWIARLTPARYNAAKRILGERAK